MAKGWSVRSGSARRRCGRTPNESYAVTDILQVAIVAASEQVDSATGQELAETLELPWDPGKSLIDPRPARIACLIIANMALMQKPPA